MARHSGPFARTDSIVINDDDDTDTIVVKSRTPTPDLDDTNIKDDIDNHSDDDDDPDLQETAYMPRRRDIRDTQAFAGRHTRRSVTPEEYLSVEYATTSAGFKVKRGNDYQLHDGDFFRVLRIIIHRRTGETLLRGILFRRNCSMDRMLPKTVNEICAVMTDVDPNNPNPRVDEHLVDVPLNTVIEARRIILTNLVFGGSLLCRKWPDHSFRDEYMEAEEAFDSGVLVCRWKRIAWDTVASRKCQSGALVRLRETECDPGKSIPDAALVYWWRELRATGGAPLAHPPGQTIDLEAGEQEIHSKKAGKRPRRGTEYSGAHMMREKRVVERDEEWFDSSGNVRARRTERSESVATQSFTPSGSKRKYDDSRHSSNPSETLVASLVSEPRTHMDYCAGAGGMALGAEMAGSFIKFLLDKCPHACATLKLKYKDGQVLEMELSDLFHKKVDKVLYKVLTVHISFPCQTLSGAHTRPGKNDIPNEDTAGSVEAILRLNMNKITTFEQTSHMVQKAKNHSQFRRLVRGLTSESFSLRWGVLEARDHDNPSKRQRLIIVASCAGHPLPLLPSPRPGPWVSARDTLRKVGPAKDIRPHMQQFTQKNGKPWDASRPLDKTITCDGGGGDLHPSGTRSFNMQELAMMAGFPRSHQFPKLGKTELRRLIGNAVPVPLAMDVYKEVHESLDEGEAEMLAWLLGELAVKTEPKPTIVKKEKVKAGDEDVIVIDDEEKSEIIVIDDWKRRGENANTANVLCEWPDHRRMKYAPTHPASMSEVWRPRQVGS